MYMLSKLHVKWLIPSEVDFRVIHKYKYIKF